MQNLEQVAKRFKELHPKDVCSSCFFYLPDDPSQKRNCKTCAEVLCASCVKNCSGCNDFFCKLCRKEQHWKEFCYPCHDELPVCGDNCGHRCKDLVTSKCGCQIALCSVNCGHTCNNQQCNTSPVCKKCTFCSECLVGWKKQVNLPWTGNRLAMAMPKFLLNAADLTKTWEKYDPLQSLHQDGNRMRTEKMGSFSKILSSRWFSYRTARSGFAGDVMTIRVRSLQTSSKKTWLELFFRPNSPIVPGLFLIHNGQKGWTWTINPFWIDGERELKTLEELFELLHRLSITITK